MQRCSCTVTSSSYWGSDGEIALSPALFSDRTGSSPTREQDMWNLADRVVKAVSDVTFGTVIVLVHVVMADRSRRALLRPVPRLPG